MPAEESSLTNTTNLIGRAQGGEQAAFESLFGRYYPRVLRIVRSRMGQRLRCHEDPEDIVQNTFIVAVQKFDTFEPAHEASLINWLAQLVEHQIQNAVRYHNALKRDHKREVVLRRIHESVTSGNLRLEIANSDSGPIERAARTEEEAVLDECLNELSREHREVILLRDFAGGEWEWIAKELGRPSTRAAQELHRRAVMALGVKATPRLPS